MSFIITNEDITSQKLGEVMKFDHTEERCEILADFFIHLSKILNEEPTREEFQVELEAYILTMTTLKLSGSPLAETAMHFTNVAERFFVLGIATGFNLSESIIRDKSLARLAEL